MKIPISLIKLDCFPIIETYFYIPIPPNFETKNFLLKNNTESEFIQFEYNKLCK